MQEISTYQTVCTLEQTFVLDVVVGSGFVQVRRISPKRRVRSTGRRLRDDFFRYLESSTCCSSRRYGLYNTLYGTGSCQRNQCSG